MSLADHLADLGPLHLDHHPTTVAQDRGVHLPERRRSQRLGLEAAVEVLDPSRRAGARRSRAPGRSRTAPRRPGAWSAPGCTTPAAGRTRVESSWPSLTYVGPIASRSRTNASARRPTSSGTVAVGPDGARRRVVVDRELVQAQPLHQVGATVPVGEPRQPGVAPRRGVGLVTGRRPQGHGRRGCQVPAAPARWREGIHSLDRAPAVACGAWAPTWQRAGEALRTRSGLVPALVALVALVAGVGTLAVLTAYDARERPRAGRRADA